MRTAVIAVVVTLIATVATASPAPTDVAHGTRAGGAPRHARVQDEGKSRKKLEGLLRKAATRWFVARQHVLRRCTKCEGSGYVARQVATRRGIITRKVACSRCRKAGCVLDKKRLAQLREVLLPEVRTLPDAPAPIPTTREIRALLGRRRIETLEQRLGYIGKRHVKIRKLEVIDGPGYVYGEVGIGSTFKKTTWFWKDGRWYVVSDDDFRRLVKEESRSYVSLARAFGPPAGDERKERFTVAEGLGTVDAGLRAAAGDAVRAISTIASRFTRAEALLCVIDEAPTDPTTLRLVVDYGAGKPTAGPKRHAADLERLVFDVAGRMQSTSWPESLTQLAVTFRPATIDSSGKVSNQSVETVLLGVTMARRLHLENLTAATVKAKFWCYDHPHEPGVVIWYGKKR